MLVGNKKDGMLGEKESIEIARDHISAALHLAQNANEGMLAYLLEMALLEAEANLETVSSEDATNENMTEFVE